MAQPIQLGPRHLVVVSSGVVTILLVMAICIAPELHAMCVREVALPPMEQRYGFTLGRMMIAGDERYAFVSVQPDGPLAKMGVRAGDSPFQWHGYGTSSLYYALVSAERGESAEFEVINADEWSGGPPVLRTIRVAPPAAHLDSVRR